MTIKIEIPAENKALAGAIGRALTEYAAETVKRVPINQEEIENAIVDKKIAAISNAKQIDKTGYPKEDEPQTDITLEEHTHTGEKVDQKGVPFIPAVCGNAKEPFYASGPRKGQWKKLRNVTDEVYDVTYNNALAQVATQTTLTDTGAEETAEDVFGNKQQQQAQTQQTDADPQKVFTLYSELVQGGLVNEANAVMQKHGLANGTLIYSRPDLGGVILPELQALSQPGA